MSLIIGLSKEAREGSYSNHKISQRSKRMDLPVRWIWWEATTRTKIERNRKKLSEIRAKHRIEELVLDLHKATRLPPTFFPVFLLSSFDHGHCDNSFRIELKQSIPHLTYSYYFKAHRTTYFRRMGDPYECQVCFTSTAIVCCVCDCPTGNIMGTNGRFVCVHVPSIIMRLETGLFFDLANHALYELASERSSFHDLSQADEDSFRESLHLFLDAGTNDILEEKQSATIEELLDAFKTGTEDFKPTPSLPDPKDIGPLRGLKRLSPTVIVQTLKDGSPITMPEHTRRTPTAFVPDYGRINRLVSMIIDTAKTSDPSIEEMVGVQLLRRRGDSDKMQYRPTPCRAERLSWLLGRSRWRLPQYTKEKKKQETKSLGFSPSQSCQPQYANKCKRRAAIKVKKKMLRQLLQFVRKLRLHRRLYKFAARNHFHIITPYFDTGYRKKEAKYLVRATRSQQRKKGPQTTMRLP
jgi:hypothetical protein